MPTRRSGDRQIKSILLQINRAPELAHLAASLQEHLIEVPSVARLRSALAKLAGKVGAELTAPLSDGLVQCPPEQAQRFLSAHAFIYGRFRPRRHLMSAAHHRRVRAAAFNVYRQSLIMERARGFALKLARTMEWRAELRGRAVAHSR